ncbi:MAG TPA: hypothetical protein VF188_04615 [Longimicrobiales bacterium]
MAVAFAVGDILVPAHELAERARHDDMARLREKPATELAFRAGTTTGHAVAEAIAAASPGEYAPIGIGRPLSLEIFSIYTGDAPGRWLPIGPKPGLLAVSAVKDLVTVDAAPRAMNQIVEKIEDRKLYEPGALAAGTPIVYYSPAVTTETLFTSFQLVVDSFDRRVIDHVADLFQSAGGLPIFAPAAAYLLAGSVLLRIAGDLGDALAESDAFLDDDLPLRFLPPDTMPDVARSAVIYNDKHAHELEGYRVAVVTEGPDQRQRRVLADRQTGQPYHGDAPYMIVSIDGRERDGLEGFQPTYATAAVLERFYPKGDRTGQAVQALSDGLALYNDLRYRRKAEDLRQRLEGLDPQSDEYKELKTLYDAYRKNIANELLQLKDPVAAGG